MPTTGTKLLAGMLSRTAQVQSTLLEQDCSSQDDTALSALSKSMPFNCRNLRQGVKHMTIAFCFILPGQMASLCLDLPVPGCAAQPQRQPCVAASGAWLPQLASPPQCASVPTLPSVPRPSHCRQTTAQPLCLHAVDFRASTDLNSLWSLIKPFIVKFFLCIG